MSDNNEILDLIKKLMAMGSSNNENEANAFMAKAYRLMAENGIQEHQLKAGVPANAVEYVQDIAKFGGRLPTEHTFIWAIVEEFFNVRLVRDGDRSNGKFISFIGQPHHVEIAMYVYDHLLVVYKSLWDMYRGRNKCPLTAKRPYYQGLETGLRNKLLAEKAMIEQEYGLVIYEDPNLESALKSIYPRLSKGVVRWTGNEAATQAGERDGAKIQLNKGLGEGGNVRQLLN